MARAGLALEDCGTGRVLVPRLEVADDFFARGVGLLGRAGLEEGAGLLLTECSAIHMFFMRFAVDAVFLDRSLAVAEVRAGLKPWRVASCRGAAHVLELPAGAAAAAGFAAGSRVRIVEGTVAHER